MNAAAVGLADLVAGLPAMIRLETIQIEARLRRLLATPDIFRLRQIILTGSGDSLIAGHAVATALRTWSGLPVQPIPAMEAARYLDMASMQCNPRSLLVVCLSSSGEGARIVEAARRLRKAGALVVAITADPASRLAQEAETVIDVALPSSHDDEQARGFVATLLGAWLLGIRIAEVRMRITMDEANTKRAMLIGQADLIERSLPLCASICGQAAEGWGGERCADLLGSGPGLGSARFAAAKLIEAAGIHATAQDTEEFFHLNYFVDRPAEVPTVLFTAADSAASSRVRELMATLRELGRPTLLVSDAGGTDPDVMRLCLPRTEELLLPLLHVAPAVMLASAWADAAASTPFRGHEGPWRGASGAGLVRSSHILPDSYINDGSA